MEREQSWNVDAITAAVLKQITILGYVVSVHLCPDQAERASRDVRRSSEPRVA
jgi:hypothetical protein